MTLIKPSLILWNLDPQTVVFQWTPCTWCRISFIWGSKQNDICSHRNKDALFCLPGGDASLCLSHLHLRWLVAEMCYSRIGPLHMKSMQHHLKGKTKRFSSHENGNLLCCPSAGIAFPWIARGLYWQTVWCMSTNALQSLYVVVQQV